MIVYLAFLSGAFLVMAAFEAGAYFEVIQTPPSSTKRAFMAIICFAFAVLCLTTAVLNNN